MNTGATIFDARPCLLGEGALWHPLRMQLFWFDILAGKLLSRVGKEELAWEFGECVSAAGWVDENRLLIASETQLFLFDIESGERTHLAPLEAEVPGTRSNDGRADPKGGFWIGTMGKKAEEGRGAIYRFHEGRVEPLFGGITIPNAICFAPDGSRAYFADTHQDVVYTVKLDAEGWPEGDREVFLDLSAEGVHPDGAVVDANGCFWNAQWGASRVARYSREGKLEHVIALPPTNTSCLAFGGLDFRTLYVTSARQDLEEPRLSDGLVYVVPEAGKGVPEPAVMIVAEC